MSDLSSSQPRIIKATEVAKGILIAVGVLVLVWVVLTAMLALGLEPGSQAGGGQPAGGHVVRVHEMPASLPPSRP